MDNAINQYRASLFPTSGNGDKPSSMVLLEVAGDFEEFCKDVQAWIGIFDCHYRSGAYPQKPVPKYRMCVEGVAEEEIYCEEEELILALLYCSWFYEGHERLQLHIGEELHGNHKDENCKVTFREACYKGEHYNISEVFFLESSKESDPEDGTECLTFPIQINAKKNGRDMRTYICGPFVKLLLYGNTVDTIDRKALSTGIVEAKEKGMHYAGTFPYSYKYPVYDEGYDSDGNFQAIHIYDDEALSDIHLFLETDGKDVTFSLLMDGRLYRKIKKDEERVIFYDTPFDSRQLANAEFNQDGNPYNVIFEKKDGEYRYSTGCKGILEDAFIPPQMPDSLDRNSANRLCMDYIRALYAVFAAPKEWKTGSGKFSRPEGSPDLYRTKTEAFELIGKIDPPVPQKALLSRYDLFEQLDACIDIVSASYTEGGKNIELIPQGDSSFAIVVKDTAKNVEYKSTFDELRKVGYLKGRDLPDTVKFRTRYQYFMEDIGIYSRIIDALVDRGLDSILMLSRAKFADYEEMRKALYPDEEKLIADEAVVSFAVEIKNEYNRTGKIPNIAVIGEAGSGKTTLVKRLGKVLFGRELLCCSPSDLKGIYIGWTEGKVARKLVDAAKNQQVFFIDEAYELMSDKFGREAVSFLLPLMTGDRTAIDVELAGETRMSVDFEKGTVIINGEESTLPHGVPPIWISGYEDDIRLMISQNQGLFRRFKRVVLEPPVTGDLYKALMQKVKDAGSGLSEDNGEMKIKTEILSTQFEKHRDQIIKFFRWGALPQNSKYFANHAGVEAFFDRCLDSMNFKGGEEEISEQIAGIIRKTKRDIRHQLDTVRRKGGNNDTQYDDSERIRLVDDIETRFRDLVGCESQIGYMEEIIDMLVKKDDYEQKHITVPKGALLLGVPGVGKTFIARAMAGQLQEEFEKKAPNKRVGFMVLSAPELTARPVSFIGSIFNTAGEYDVCIIFIDEVDAIARKRFQNDYYSHFIELIKQMDGIEQHSNVFILAATNAPESLDPAFTRSGRIDKMLSFTPPDKDARKELAKRSIEKRQGALDNFICGKNQENVNKLSEEVAGITVGYTPGDIENVINEAFIRYKRNQEEPGWKQKGKEFGNSELNRLYCNIYEEVERRNIGDPRPVSREKEFSADKNDGSCSATAIHEVGHALVSILCGGEPFEKITSLPRGSALGYVISARKTLETKVDFENCIRGKMGGRIAEEIVYGKENVSVGASTDMKQATALARDMVERFSFTEEFGFMALREDTARHLNENTYSCSEAFRGQIDEAVRRLLEKLYRETREKLEDKKELIIALAREVFKREIMTGEEFCEIYEKLTKA